MSATIKPGFKQTEVGVIPEDWGISLLDDCCALITKGTTPTSLGKNFASEGIRFLKAESISETGHSISDKVAFIDEATHAMLKRSQLAIGDLLISIAGVLGRIGVVEDADIPGNTNQALAIVRLGKHSVLNRMFLFYSLRSPVIEKQIRDINVQAAQANISLRNVRDFCLPVPPPPEQRAIAEALSDVDGLLGALDRLIAKKRDLKQAAMQQLLTAQIRLPGFAGEWGVKRLGEVCGITTGRKDVNEGNPSGEYPFFTCAREHTFSDSFSFEGEAILIAGNGEVGNLSYIKGRFEAYQRTYVLQRFTTDVSYLWHQLSAYLAASLGIGKIGSSIPYILMGNLVEFEFRAPVDVSEQTAIAEVLSEMDAELAALEQRREKTRALKQGMMQELLTGRTRLV